MYMNIPWTYHPWILGHGVEVHVYKWKVIYSGVWCVSMDIPWMSQLLCHPRILGHGVEVHVYKWKVIYSGVWCVSMDIPWMSQLLCHPWILGHGVEVYMVCVHGHSLDVPVTVSSTDTRTWGGITLYSVCPWTFPGHHCNSGICGY